MRQGKETGVNLMNEPEMSDEDQIEEQEVNDTYNSNQQYPENILELNKWIIDPHTKDQIIKKDNALTYMEKDDINMSTGTQDLAYLCRMHGFDKAFNYFMFMNDSEVVTRRSWKGFERKQESTVHQEKEVNISRTKEKKKRLLGW